MGLDIDSEEDSKREMSIAKDLDLWASRLDDQSEDEGGDVFLREGCWRSLLGQRASGKGQTIRAIRFVGLLRKGLMYGIVTILPASRVGRSD